jgi:hypothetical protein
MESIQENKAAADALYDIVCKGHDGHQSLLTRISILERENRDKEERLVDVERFHIQFRIEDRKTKLYIFWLLIGLIVMMFLFIVLDSSNIERLKWIIDFFK